MSKFARLLLELNLIKANPGISVSRLAKETNVSERTIYRDINSLSSSLVPVYYEEGYRLLDTAFLPTLNFTADEYKLLRLASECCAFKRDDLQMQLRSMISKVDAVLDPKIRSFVNSLSENNRILCRQPDRKKHITTFAQVLERAIQGTRKVKLYCNVVNDGVTERTIHPYTLIFRNHSWHLLGFCEHVKDFCMLNLSHFKRIAILDETFIKNLNFSIEAFFENKWEILGGKLCNVQIKFTGTAAKSILSSQHHPKEKVTKLREGPVIYSIEVEGLEEITNWVIKFGKEAEVLQPRELRERIFRLGNDLTKIYASRVSETTRK